MNMIPKTMSIKEYFTRRDSRRSKRFAKGVELGLRPEKGPPPKRKAKSERIRLRDQLDELFSQLIRIRDKRLRGSCPFCGSMIQCCFHILTRSKYKTRWLETNAVGACHSCNLRYEHDTTFIIKVHQWYVCTYGQAQFDDLTKTGHGLANFLVSDFRAIRDDLRIKLLNVCRRTNA